MERLTHRDGEPPPFLNKPQPDVVVRCGRLGGRNFITDSRVVVEVLSPSTMDVDRGDKLRFYKELPRLWHVALIYQDQVRVEHCRERTKAGVSSP